MAKLLQMGFENGLQPFTEGSKCVLSMESASPLSGDYSIKHTGTTSFNTGSSPLWLGTAATVGDGLGVAGNFRISGATQGTSFLAIQISSTSSITLHVHEDGSVDARRYSSTTIPASATNGTSIGSAPHSTATLGADHHFACMVVPDNSNGSIILAIDGVVVIDESGIDTQHSTANTSRGVYIQHRTNNTDVVFDDLIIFDDTGADWNSIPVPMKIEALRLDGQISAQFVGSDGNSVDNHLLLDEHPISESDYTESSTVAEADLFTIADRVGSGAVQSVVVCAIASNPDGGNNSLELVLKSGATSVNSDAKGLAATAVEVAEAWDLDPNTAAAWTDAAVNALEIGYEVA